MKQLFYLFVLFLLNTPFLNAQDIQTIYPELNAYWLYDQIFNFSNRFHYWDTSEKAYANCAFFVNGQFVGSSAGLVLFTNSEGNRDTACFMQEGSLLVFRKQDYSRMFSGNKPKDVIENVKGRDEITIAYVIDT